MRGKKFIIIIIAIVILAVSLVNKLYVKEINKSQININQYIENTDTVSGNYSQVNWKEVAAILAVSNKNKMKDINDVEIREIANLFLDKDDNNEGYTKLYTLNEVIGIIGFDDREKKLANRYLDDLKDFGTKPERLQSDSKYMKFIDEIKVDSIKNYEEYGILPSITIAQAILESNWGESILSNDYNNLFGIKADSNWKGQYVTLETLEHKDTMVDSKFRRYNDKGKSIKDHAEFLFKNKRYRENGVFETNTYIYQANALEKAGYSTAVDENGKKVYAKRLIDLIRQYNLQLIDSEAQTNA
ncbi:glycoside hydrolase family 73 protein [Metaclostridioides mangenotii]|uniref:glycoside hydrolase family 73 protein n=1 Tax=Metaclostridioides mangenotii TaxID=1540 RepID=UPI0026F064A1|nr:glucosaminidase domain-containing protein [Clostridioides mangenotii]